MEAPFSPDDFLTGFHFQAASDKENLLNCMV